MSSIFNTRLADFHGKFIIDPDLSCRKSGFWKKKTSVDNNTLFKNLQKALEKGFLTSKNVSTFKENIEVLASSHKLTSVQKTTLQLMVNKALKND